MSLSSTLWRKVKRPPLPLPRVPASQSVAANDEDVGEHLHTVPQHAHLGARGVGPANRYFFGAQTVMACQIEQFRIEAEPLDALLRKNDFALFAFEGFEAALGVYKRQTQTEAHHGVENDAGKFAKRRLMRADQAAVHGAGTDGHVVIAIDGTEEFVSLFDGSGEIGVRKKGEAPLRLQHAVTHTKT